MAAREVVGAAVIEIATELSKFERGIATGINRLKRLHDRFAAIGKISIAVGGAILAAWIPVLKVTAAYQQEMANVNSVLNVSAQTMERVSEVALEVGRTTYFSAKMAGEGMYYLASAGFNVQQVMRSLPPIIRLAIATQFNLAETTKLVITTMRAFQLPVEQTTRVVNTFAAAIASSQARIELLWMSMAYVAPIAHMMGWNIEKAVTALSLLYNAGYSASLAATSFRGTIDRLIRPTTRSKIVLEELGLTFEDIVMPAHEFADVIDLLRERGIKTSQIYEWMGRRAAPAMAVFLALGGDAFRKFEEKITGTNKAFEMSRIQMDTLQREIGRLGSRFKVLFIALGKGIAGPVKNLVRWIGNLILGFEKVLNVVPGLTTAFSALSVAIGAAAVTFGILNTAAGLWIRVSPILKASLKSWHVYIIAGVVALTLLASLLAWATKKYEMQAKAAQELTQEIDSQAVEMGALAEEYNKVGKIQERSVSQMERMYEIGRKLREMYPELSESLKDLGQASEITTAQLNELNAAQIRAEVLTRMKERLAIERDLIQMKKQLAASAFMHTGALYHLAAATKQYEWTLAGITETGTRWGYGIAYWEAQQKKALEGVISAQEEVDKLNAGLTSGRMRYKLLTEVLEEYVGQLRTMGYEAPALERYLEFRPPPELLPQVTGKPEDFLKKMDIAAIDRRTRAAEGGGAPVTNIDVHVDGPVTEQTARDLGRDVGYAVDAALRRGEL